MKSQTHSRTRHLSLWRAPTLFALLKLLSCQPGSCWPPELPKYVTMQRSVNGPEDVVRDLTINLSFQENTCRLDYFKDITTRFCQWDLQKEGQTVFSPSLLKHNPPTFMLERILKLLCSWHCWYHWKHLSCSRLRPTGGADRLIYSFFRMSHEGKEYSLTQ